MFHYKPDPELSERSATASAIPHAGAAQPRSGVLSIVCMVRDARGRVAVTSCVKSKVGRYHYAARGIANPQTIERTPLRGYPLLGC